MPRFAQCHEANNRHEHRVCLYYNVVLHNGTVYYVGDGAPRSPQSCEVMEERLLHVAIRKAMHSDQSCCTDAVHLFASSHSAFQIDRDADQMYRGIPALGITLRAAASWPLATFALPSARPRRRV